MPEAASRKLGSPDAGFFATRETHFVQQGDGPVFIGPGAGTLECGCGHALINGYDQVRFLAVGIRCGRCGQLTTTPPLPENAAPPFAAIVAEPVAELRPVTTTLPAHVFVIGRAEMDRISGLYRPVTPASNLYRITPALLEEAIAAHDQYGGGLLAIENVNPGDLYLGLADHPLAGC